MHAGYDSTIDDFVEVQRRAGLRSKTIRRLKFRNALSVALIAGLIVCVLVPGTLKHKLIYAACSMVVGFAAAMSFIPVLIERNVKKMFREQFGPGPIRFDIDLAEDGITIRQMETRIVYEWPSVVAVEDKSDAVEFVLKNGGYVVVFNKGFESSDTRKSFLDYAIAHVPDKE
jgi:hypothetical protein